MNLQQIIIEANLVNGDSITCVETERYDLYEVGAEYIIEIKANCLPTIISHDEPRHGMQASFEVTQEAEHDFF